MHSLEKKNDRSIPEGIRINAVGKSKQHTNNFPLHFWTTIYVPERTFEQRKKTRRRPNDCVVEKLWFNS